MADQIAHNAVSVGFRVLLHGCPDVGNVVAGPCKLQRFKEAFPRDRDELLHILRHVADENRACRIPMESIQLCADIQAQDIAVAELVFPGNPMHDLLIDGCADAFGISAVIQERGICSLFPDIRFGNPVKLLRRHSDFRLLRKKLQGFLNDVARCLHLFDVGRVLDRDPPHHTSFSVRARISFLTASGVLSPSTVRSMPFAP